MTPARERMVTVGRRARWVLAAAVAPVLAPRPAGAAIKDFNPAIITGNWNVNNNWVPVNVPAAGDIVRISNTNGQTVTLNVTTPLIRSLTVNNTGTGTTTFVLASNFTLSTIDDLSIGIGGKTVMSQSAGTVSVGGSVIVGQVGPAATYAMSGGSLTSSAQTIIGLGGTGTFNHSGGTVTLSTFLRLGADQPTDFGTYSMSNGASLTVGNEERVGDFGTGVFNQTGGTHAAQSAVRVGVNGTGTANVSGGAWTVSGTLSVGDSQDANGTVNHSAGTVMAKNTGAEGLDVGRLLGSLGDYNLSGTGVLQVSGGENVGLAGIGTFDQTGGAHTVTGLLSVGASAGGLGAGSLSNGTWTANAAAYVGDFGTGAFAQTGGAMTVNGQDASSFTLALGRNATGVGTYTMSNTASLTVNGNESIGAAGKGTFTQNAGTHMVSDNLSIGFGASATGTANLNGGTWTVTNGAFIGYLGKGTFNQTGGTFAATVLINLADQAGSSGTATVSGGVLTTSALNVGARGAGTFVQGGGTVNATSSLVVGQFAGSTGSLSVSNTARLIVGAETVGGLGNGAVTQTGGSHTASTLVMAGATNVTGVFNLSGGALNVTNDASVGSSGTGAFSQSGGTNTVGGGLVIGEMPWSVGTYTLSGGVLSGNDVRVGAAGAGTFSHSAGTHNANVLSVGKNQGGTGTYTLSGTGDLNVAFDESVGADGAGHFVMTGGAHDVAGQLRLSATGAAATGVADLTGGRWTVNAAIVGVAAPATFNQGGGTFVANTSLAIAPAGAFFNDSSYNLNGPGGTLTSPLIEVGAGGKGRLAVFGGTVTGTNVTVYPNGTLALAGGTIVNATIDQRGALAVTGGSTIAKLVAAAGSANKVDANLTVNGGLTNDFGATFSGTGRLTLAAGAVGTGWGLIAPSVTLSAATTTLTAKGGILLLGGTSLVSAGTLATLPGTTMISYAAAPAVTGSLVVGAGSTMSFAGPVSIGTGKSVTLSGGVLSAPALTNTLSGQVNGYGQVAGAIANDGFVTTTGPTQFAGNVTNAATGVITARNSQLLIAGATLNNGTIRAQAGGSVVFVGALTGNPAAGGVPAGAAVLAASTSMLASAFEQGSMTLDGTSGNPATYSLATVRPAAEGGQTSVLGSLTFVPDAGDVPKGRLDLADNALIVNYPAAGPTPAAGVRAALASAYAPQAANHWAGPGLTSSAAAADASRALGYAEAAEILGPTGGTFRGQPADATSVLVRYTLAGDATLDGGVDFDDLVQLAQNYNVTDGARTWFKGDFDYDGNCDFNDLVKLAQNYNTALPAAPVPGASAGFERDWAAALAGVPEPGGAALSGIAAGAMLARRRRRGRAGPEPDNHTRARAGGQQFPDRI